MTEQDTPDSRHDGQRCGLSPVKGEIFAIRREVLLAYQSLLPLEGEVTGEIVAAA